jgi:hypothetical protein
LPPLSGLRRAGDGKDGPPAQAHVSDYHHLTLPNAKGEEQWKTVLQG